MTESSFSAILAGGELYITKREEQFPKIWDTQQNLGIRDFDRISIKRKSLDSIRATVTWQYRQNRVDDRVYRQNRVDDWVYHQNRVDDRVYRENRVPDFGDRAPWNLADKNH